LAPREASELIGLLLPSVCEHARALISRETAQFDEDPPDRSRIGAVLIPVLVTEAEDLIQRDVL
jgi:hypothetical protein